MTTSKYGSSNEHISCYFNVTKWDIGKTILNCLCVTVVELEEWQVHMAYPNITIQLEDKMQLYLGLLTTDLLLHLELDIPHLLLSLPTRRFYYGTR